MSVRFRAVFAAFVVCLAAGADGQAPSVVTTLTLPYVGGRSNASQFTEVGDAVYFHADPDGVGAAIWKWSEADGAVRVKSTPGVYGSSASVAMMAFGEKLLFSAFMDGRGAELWITDGTTDGTGLLKDIYFGGSSSPQFAVTSESLAYFTAFDSDHGRELWVTDGTEAGTTLVADLTGDSSSSNPTSFVLSGGKLYFHAANQFWISDGTEAGTLPLASGVSGTPAGVLNGQVVFLGSDDTNGRELWSTDGTPGGTAMLKDINPGPVSSWGGIPTSFVQSGGVLLFFADDAAGGRELWSTDGTSAGTQLVRDLTPGAASTALEQLVSSGVGAFFVVDGTTLWFSDGTPAGTTAIGTFSDITALVGAANGAFLVTSEPSLVFSDGTPAEATQITNIQPANPSELTAIGARALFLGNDEIAGIEPWVSDGTDEGTSILADIATYYYTPLPGQMKAAANKVFFRLGDAVFASDGTPEGTLVIGPIAGDYYSSIPAAELGTTFLYRGGEDETLGLWRSDGTAIGTALVKPFKTIREIFTSHPGYALLVGSESGSGSALWRTDGSEAGTTRLPSTGATQFTDVAGTTYFLASGGGYSYGNFTELWSTAGTALTTRRVMTGEFNGLMSAGGALYFTNRETETGRELWRSDGTADGAAMVKDIAPGEDSSDPQAAATLNHILFFTAADDLHGRELWRSDGTDAGTFLLRDLEPGRASPWIQEFVSSGAYLYFITRTAATGDYELWRSDGTPSGTILLTANEWASSLAGFDAKVIFSGSDSFRGTEMWESTGSVSGTYATFDLEPGSESSNPRNFTTTSDRLFFTTDESVLWVMDRAQSRFTIADQRITEGDSGSETLDFTVLRTGDITGSATVAFATEDLTATAGADYEMTSGSLLFAPGQTTGQISIHISGDVVLEKNESFLVALSASSDAVIIRDRAFGIIEENDRKVALSLEYVPRFTSSWTPGRTFRITNAGPSGATVTLNVSESPFEGKFHCDGSNPSVCSVGFVPAGGSVEFVAYRQTSAGRADSSLVPGRTLTASVTALEPEADLSDNAISRMINANGYISLPPFLIAGSTATAEVSSYEDDHPSTVELSLSGGVIVSPLSATVTEAEPVASMTLSVAPNAWGWSTVRTGTATPQMRVPIVLAGEDPKLDTALYVDTSEGFSFDYDEPVVLSVRVAATLPDGTRPSGTVFLRKGESEVIQVQALDNTGSATFSVSDVPVGSHSYDVAYSGDSAFNALTVDLQSVYVEGLFTDTDVVILDHACGDPQIVVNVSSGNGDPTPTGTVNFMSGSTVLGTVVLEPTDTLGYARAIFDNSFAIPRGSIRADYVPESPFHASYDWFSYYTGICPPPTLIASAASTGSVSLLWSDVGAPQYEIVRSESPFGSVFSSLETTSSTTFLDTSAVAGKAYLYKVLAKTASGEVRSTSAADLAAMINFIDDPIMFGATPIKAVHITQLHQAANAIRLLAGLPEGAFLPVTAGGAVRATDITTLRDAIAEALVALSQPSPPWIDGAEPSSFVKALHVQQLRNVMK